MCIMSSVVVLVVVCCCWSWSHTHQVFPGMLHLLATVSATLEDNLQAWKIMVFFACLCSSPPTSLMCYALSAHQTQLEKHFAFLFLLSLFNHLLAQKLLHSFFLFYTTRRSLITHFHTREDLLISKEYGFGWTISLRAYMMLPKAQRQGSYCMHHRGRS